MTKINDILFGTASYSTFVTDGTWSSTEKTTLAIADIEEEAIGGSMNILVIGGSGFIGSALVSEAIKANHDVTVVSRGNLPVPAGVTHIKADRKNPGELESALCQTNTRFNLVVDCISDDENDIAQDIKLFSSNCGRLVVLSSDLVFAPEKRTFPQGESCEKFVTGKSAVADWRKAELALFNASSYYTNWTILRPCHVYGHGHLCGASIPPFKTDADIRQFIADGKALDIPGGGHFLIQPIFVNDLARIILDCPMTPGTKGKAFTCAGPDITEIARFYQAIAAGLDSTLEINETPLASQLAAFPDSTPYFCHRIYTLKALKQSGLPLPNTTLADGIAISL